MGTIRASVTQAEEWDRVVRKVKALPREIKTSISQSGRTRIAGPLADAVRSAQLSSPEKQVQRMAGTTKATMRAGLPTVITGGQPYARGAEFGGQKRRTTHYSTSRRGVRYIVIRRRSTMQFRQHRGTEGYEVYPTIRDVAPRLIDEYEDIITEVFARMVQ